MKLSLYAALIGLGLVRGVLAHGDLHEQIEEISRRIRRAPSAELFLKRGELHRAHQDFEPALADYDAAERRRPGMEAVLFCRGRTLFEAGRFAPARASLDRFLQAKPEHAEGYLMRARVNAALKDFGAAVKDFDRVIELAPGAGPDQFLERAQAQGAQGDFDGAIKVLDEAMLRIGPLFTLQAQAVEVERTRKSFDAALGRVDDILAQAQRKESWLMEKGAILEEAGRPEEAQRSYQAALAAIEALPPHLHATKATQEIESRSRLRAQSLAPHLSSALASPTPVP